MTRRSLLMLCALLLASLPLADARAYCNYMMQQAGLCQPPPPPPPPAPQLSVTAQDSAAKLRVDQDYGAWKWQYRMLTGDEQNYGNWQPSDSHIASRTFTITDLTNGTAYTFQIRTLWSGDRVSGPSNSVTVTPTESDATEDNTG